MHGCVIADLHWSEPSVDFAQRRKGKQKVQLKVTKIVFTILLYRNCVSVTH
jgi:hypothetical protein